MKRLFWTTFVVLMSSGLFLVAASAPLYGRNPDVLVKETPASGHEVRYLSDKTVYVEELQKGLALDIPQHPRSEVVLFQQKD